MPATGSDPILTVSDIARAARARNGRALVVGGWVRDRLLGVDTRLRPSGFGEAGRDLDVEIFGVPAADLPALLAPFGRVEPVGQSFPVYKIGTIDIAPTIAALLGLKMGPVDGKALDAILTAPGRLP